MSELDWRAVDRKELAALLAASTHVASSAVGTATVYRIEHDGRRQLVVALPDNDAVVVEETSRTARRRRQTDAG